MTNEEARGNLFMLYDTVDEEGVIDTHTWYKGIQDNIRESLSMAIKALEQEPCEDAISRQEVLDWLKRVTITDGITFETGFKQILYDIEQMPPVNPQEPKEGHWIAQDIHNCHTDFKCSECGYIHSFMHLYGQPTADYTYCPNCGCRMVEPQESEE